VQAHTSGEVGILGTILLSVYSGTTFAIFIEIGLYLREKEQKISWQFFLRHGVFYYTKVAIYLRIQTDAVRPWQAERNMLPSCEYVPQNTLLGNGS